ncbi:MAG: hypothetical protein HYU64_19495 [Armatimonadetes bacterium]|nr:hypothetical protein [Armatimonadota bacterium]
MDFSNTLKKMFRLMQEFSEREGAVAHGPMPDLEETDSPRTWQAARQGMELIAALERIANNMLFFEEEAQKARSFLDRKIAGADAMILEYQEDYDPQIEEIWTLTMDSFRLYKEGMEEMRQYFEDRDTGHLKTGFHKVAAAESASNRAELLVRETKEEAGPLEA